MLCQLGASKSILSALRGRPGHGKVSSAERHRLQSSLRMVALGSLDLARIAEGVLGAGFQPDDEAALLDTIAEGAGQAVQAPLAKAGRSSMRNYEQLANYLPETVWSHIKEGHIQDYIDFLMRLGLRNPSEPTSQVMALVVLHQTDGFVRACEMAPHMKLEFVKSIKTMFKVRAKLVVSPVAFAQSLPQMPEDLRKQYPVLYEAAFSAEGPVASRISELELAQLKAGSRMRVVKGGPLVNPYSLQSAGGHNSMGLTETSGLCFPPSLVQFGQGLLMQMQHIANDVAQLKSGPLAASAAAGFQMPRPLMALTLPGARPFPNAAPAVASAAAPATATAPAAAAAAADEAGTAATAADSAALALLDVGMASESRVVPMSVEEATRSIMSALQPPTKDKAKAKNQPRPKGKTKSMAKSKAKGKVEGKAKATAGVPPVPAMPPLRKVDPIHFRTCTIYSDATKKQWRAVESKNRRKDVKFAWKLGKEAWDRCVQWCIDNST